MVAIQYEKARRDVCMYVDYPLFYIGMCPPHSVRKEVATFTLPLCHHHMSDIIIARDIVVAMDSSKRVKALLICNFWVCTVYPMSRDSDTKAIAL